MKAVRRPCPLCGGSDETTPVLTKQTLELVRCRACALVFADPLPPEGTDAYYDRLGRPYYLSPDKLAGDYAAVRFRRELGLFHRFCPEGDVLDVGCSTGAFLFQLARRFPGVYRGAGIEVSTAALEHARKRGLEVIDDSLLSHDFGARRFDAITFWAVLEHLAEPAAFVRRAADLLRPGGRCFVLVPNFRALAVRLLGARYRYVLPQHVNYFTDLTLRRFLGNAGLVVEAQGGSHFNPMVIWQDWRRGTDAPVPDAERAALLRRTTGWKEAGWLRPARGVLGIFERLLAAVGLADNVWAVAGKPKTPR